MGALLAELEAAAEEPFWYGRSLDTLYFGGGTPSLLAPSCYEQIIDSVARHWPWASPPEVTLEANPEDIDVDRLAGYRTAGINRLSLGVQSFQPAVLFQLGRRHDGAGAAAAFDAARRAGFANINIDLIFGVPGQSLAQWAADLEAVVRLGPEHVSVYGLTYEDRTAFGVWRARGRLVPVSEDVEAAMFLAALERLEAAGYCHYEISNYAKSGSEARHNLAYWKRRDCLALGAGAHGFENRGWGFRWANERHPARYIDLIEQRKHARAFGEVLSRQQAMIEQVFLGLRQAAGIDRAAFAGRFAIGIDEQFPNLRALCRAGYLEPSSGGYRLTRRGMLVADAVFASLV